MESCFAGVYQEGEDAGLPFISIVCRRIKDYCRTTETETGSPIEGRPAISR